MFAVSLLLGNLLFPIILYFQITICLHLSCGLLLASYQDQGEKVCWYYTGFLAWDLYLFDL